MKEIFNEIKLYTDDAELMKTFASLVVKFGEHMGGETKCVALAPSDYGFVDSDDSIIFMYDDMSSETSFCIMKAEEFVKYFIETLNEVDEEDVEFIFKDEIKKIL